jgi:replicative DNA helicase
MMAQPAEALAIAPVPPQNLDAEESVLGAMMLSPSAVEAVSEIIDAGDFYRESHSKIYLAALELYQHGQPVDAITVADKLDERGEIDEVGGTQRIHEIAALVPATSNARHYAKIVREMATLRGLTHVGEQIQRLGWDRPGETTELVDQAEQMVFDLAQNRIRGSFDHVELLVRESFEQITKMYESGGQMTGTPTGFRDVDSMTSGLQPGNLVIVAGRPSMGKSAFALGVASNLAMQHGIPVAVFTLEMSKIEVVQRFMCAEARVELQRLRTGKLTPEDWPRLVKACDTLTKAPIYVDDTRMTTMLEIRAKARRLKARETNLGLIIVDYLQLMGGGSIEHRVQEVSQISRSLKMIAGDLDVPVMALSQLSRAVESRTDKRPLLSDLRDSGCLGGETRVYLPAEGVYRPIRELAGTSGFRVLAVDPNSWRLEPRTVTHAFSTGTKPVYRLTTRLGHQIRATGNHRFLAFDGWRRLDDLAPGIRVSVPRVLTGPRGGSLSDPQLALLGHLTGGGCTLRRHAIRYTSRDADLAHIVAGLAREVFGDASRAVVRRSRGSFQTHLAAARPRTRSLRQPVAAWLDELGAFGFRAPKKRVPERVFEQGRAGIATFLRHLWATGGDVVPGRGRSCAVVRYDASSEELARDVQSLLLRLGITATRRVVSTGARGLPIQRLTVAGKADVGRFLCLVGGVGERREAACAELRKQLALGDGNTMPAPAWRTTAEPALETARGTTRALQSSLRTPDRASSFDRTATSRERAALEAGIAASERLAALATSDVYWDEVVSVEPDGEDEVYDLTVDGLHNFVAEDIIVHNSIEQDADLVMFLYRDEYYNEQSEDQGLAEVILAKHRNGPVGTEKLAFLKRYAKFSDLAPRHNAKAAA